MHKRICIALSVLCLTSTIHAGPGSQIVPVKVNPVVHMYTQMKNFVKSDAVINRAQKAWEVAKVVAVATVLANICLPNGIKQSLGRTPLLGRFVFDRSAAYVKCD
jgi:hypothetical protein